MPNFTVEPNSPTRLPRPPPPPLVHVLVRGREKARSENPNMHDLLNLGPQLPEGPPRLLRPPPEPSWADRRRLEGAGRNRSVRLRHHFIIKNDDHLSYIYYGYSDVYHMAIPELGRVDRPHATARGLPRHMTNGTPQPSVPSVRLNAQVMHPQSLGVFVEFASSISL